MDGIYEKERGKWKVIIFLWNMIDRKKKSNYIYIFTRDRHTKIPICEALCPEMKRNERKGELSASTFEHALLCNSYNCEIAYSLSLHEIGDIYAYNPQKVCHLFHSLIDRSWSSFTSIIHVSPLVLNLKWWDGCVGTNNNPLFYIWAKVRQKNQS